MNPPEIAPKTLNYVSLDSIYGRFQQTFGKDHCHRDEQGFCRCLGRGKKMLELRKSRVCVCDALEVSACLRPALLMACFESAEGVCRIKKQTATPTRMPLRKDQAKWVGWEPGWGQMGVMLRLHCAQKTFHLESRKTEKGWREVAKRQVWEGAQGLGKDRTGLYANSCSTALLDLLCEGQVKEVKASS